MIFKNRSEAGKLLAKRLKKLQDEGKIVDPVVVALPRGGVPVGLEIAKELKAPMDILFVKKIPSPLDEEAAIGSISESGQMFISKEALERLKSIGVDVDNQYIQEKATEKIQEIARLRDKYKLDPLPLENKDVIIVDDGIATGATVFLAANAVVMDIPRNIIIAVPVAPADAEVMNMLRNVSHHIEVLEMPYDFSSVGQWYEDFHQLDDKEMKELIKEILKLRESLFH